MEKRKIGALEVSAVGVGCMGITHASGAPMTITYVAFSPMANGFLSGRYSQDSVFEKGTDYRSDMPQYTAAENKY